MPAWNPELKKIIISQTNSTQSKTTFYQNAFQIFKSLVIAGLLSLEKKKSLGAIAFQSTPGTSLKTLNSSKQLSCWSSAIPAEQNSMETIKHPNSSRHSNSSWHFLSYLSLK